MDEVTALKKELETRCSEIAQLRAQLNAHQQTEAELQERLALYHRLTNHIGDVTYQNDYLSKTYLHLDSGIEALTGIPASEMTLGHWFPMAETVEMRGEAEGLSIEEAATRMEKGLLRGWSMEMQIRAHDGQMRWLADASVPIFNSQGKIQGSFGILRDITRQRRAEEALQESERRFRSLLETIQLIAVLLDLDGNITFVNDYFLTLTGSRREKILGKNWFELFIPTSERNAVYGSFTEKIGRGVIAPRDENHILTLIGEQRLVAWNNTMIRNLQGEVIGVASIGVDITERAQLEEQLRHAQKMEGVGLLAGGIAHDFNNLLTAIIGFTEMIEEYLPPGSPALPHIHQIFQVTDRASDMIRQLLAFARKQQIHPRLTDLNELVQHAEKILRRLIGENIALITHLQPGIGLAMVDPSQFEQILFNLAINGRDAMPDGGKLLIETADVYLDADYARYRPEVVPGPHIQISVSDTGSGITSEVLPRIFEPFFTTKENEKGTGLGLATCYGIVKQVKGHIWVYSEPGRGTTFKIFLPQVAHGVCEAPASVVCDKSLHGEETVLVVEDEAPVREIIAQVLRARGYKTLMAADGVEAQRLVQEITSPLHLLITDMVMPLMNGGQIAEKLRRLHPNLRVLYISGYTEQTIRYQEGEEEELVPFLSKPFTSVALMQKVRAILDSDLS